MARGYVKPYNTRVGRNTWSWRSTLRYHAWVESQGHKVWSDDGWSNLADAMTETARITQAFSITDAKGQHHIPWSQVVDEAPDDI